MVLNAGTEEIVNLGLEVKKEGGLTALLFYAFF
jgi:hypothetical protein